MPGCYDNRFNNFPDSVLLAELGLINKWGVKLRVYGWESVEE